MKEKFAVICVVVVLAAVPVLVFVYQGVYRPSRCSERVIDITGVGARGAWTLETVRGLNYWWKSFEPATIHIRLNEQVLLHRWQRGAQGTQAVEPSRVGIELRDAGTVGESVATNALTDRSRGSSSGSS